MPDGQGKVHLVDLEAKDVNPTFDVTTDIFFYLFTKNNPTIPQKLYIGDNAGLAASNFNAKHPTRFVCHGWNADARGLGTFIGSAYFSQGDFNIISVDWTAGSNTINYLSARGRVLEVGRYVASFIDYLTNVAGLGFEDLHISGFSLGAQVIGVAGKHANRSIHTVVGLDPALPLFSLSDTDRISAESGSYVEIIHGNGGLLGFLTPIGVADFYPNGGKTQPGCGIDLTGGCSHQRAVHYFVESITSATENAFWSWNCANFDELMAGNCEIVNVMRMMGTSNKGLTSNNGLARGIYYLITNKKSPYSQGRPPGPQGRSSK